MGVKRIVGIALLILGVASMLLSKYITEQVAEGKLKIAKGEKQVQQGKQLFSLSPTTKELSKGVTGSAQKKIDAGKQQVRDYEAIAERLEIGGIVLVLIGGVLFLMSFADAKKKR